MYQGTQVHSIRGNKSKFRAYRPNDYILDPNHVVSGPKDYQKYLIQAAREEAQMQICPNYSSMFSDHPRYPRMTVTIRRIQHLAQYEDTSWNTKQEALMQHPQKKMDVKGADRHFFFRRPMIPFLHPVLPSVRFEPLFPVPQKKAKRMEEETQEKSFTTTQGTQTDYRESEAQTSPWEPPYTVIGDNAPEVLSLAMLSWGTGLPAGMHEVQIIERLRMKRAWEATVQKMDEGEGCPFEKRRDIVETIERDEWAFREQEIETIQNMRLELAKQMLEDNQKALSVRLAGRLDRYCTARKEETEKKVQKIHHEKDRAIRKLSLQYMGISKKYHKPNIIEEHLDRKSEIYAPQLRFGNNPKRWNEVIKVSSDLLTQMRGIEILENAPPKALPAFDYIKAAIPKPKNILCIRETRWTEEVLEKLHVDLKAIREKRTRRHSSLGLITKIPAPPVKPETPTFEGIPDWEEEVYQSSLFLQKIIKGRAVQSQMYKEREKCQELIEEIKSTHALIQSGIERHNEERLDARAQLREQALLKFEEDRLSELVTSLEGQTVANLMDFLSKELWRLQDERRAHAFALLADRERHRREAEEAGRRQAEERRRREHDEMFKQVVKCHQDTVDLYLENIIMESMSWVAEAEAREYIKQMVNKIDQAAYEAQLRGDAIEEEELVADLINNFVVPEVQKELIRKKIKIRQEKYLRAAHESIFKKMDPKREDPCKRDTESTEEAHSELLKGLDEEETVQFDYEESRYSLGSGVEEEEKEERLIRLQDYTTENEGRSSTESIISKIMGDIVETSQCHGRVDNNEVVEPESPLFE